MNSIGFWTFLSPVFHNQSSSLLAWTPLVHFLQYREAFLPFTWNMDNFTCYSLIKPQITFNRSLDSLPFASLMTNYSSTIGPGIQLGKENGLTLLLGKGHFAHSTIISLNFVIFPQMLKYMITPLALKKARALNWPFIPTWISPSWLWVTLIWARDLWHSCLWLQSSETPQIRPSGGSVRRKEDATLMESLSSSTYLPVYTGI